MTAELQVSIENYLLARDPGDWVPIPVLVERFSIPDERELRATGRHPGPLSYCTIFSSQGVKHIAHTTTMERIKCKNRIRRELISRARRLRWFNTAIGRCLDRRANPPVEKHTGQSLLFTP